MVGGGIFAVLGLAVQLSGGGTYIAFALAGIVALITSYSYAKLSVAYPSQGGTVEFLDQAFGPGLITGGLNVLLFLSYIVMLSLYAFAFGSYLSSFFPVDSQVLWRHIGTSGIIILMTGLNVLGARAVGKAEEWIVAFKISILMLFILVGIWSVNTGQLQPSTWAPFISLVAGGMIIFLVAYEGFELIANSAEDVKNPSKTLPRSLLLYSHICNSIIRSRINCYCWKSTIRSNRGCKRLCSCCCCKAISRSFWIYSCCNCSTSFNWFCH